LAVEVKDLLEAGVHFGHQTKRWNPKMKKFIFDKRNGIYLIDLAKTKTQLDAACEYLRKVTMDGGAILFVGTKKQAQQSVKESAGKCNMPCVTERWLGGTLTNMTTVRRSVKRLQMIDGIEKDGKFVSMHKKEVASLRREQFRLHKNLDGIVHMEKLPAALFVIDVKREDNAVREANRLKIPVVAIVDTNCDPDPIDYPIACNDDAIKAIKLVTAAVADTIAEARAEYERRLPRKAQPQEEKPADVMPVAAEASATQPVAGAAAA
jgi:small subunit ribosomal protein S2